MGIDENNYSRIRKASHHGRAGWWAEEVLEIRNHSNFCEQLVPFFCKLDMAINPIL
jgi:hypothetical protein